MEESTIYKILIVESSDNLKIRIKEVLASNEFELTFVSSAEYAFTCLDRSLKKPFALIISSYQMPKMKGDIILEKAKEYSPDTQRMLLADSSDIGTVISAINIAEIKCCLALPFKNHEFLSRVRHACKQFDHIRQKAFLTKITERQNKQMYKIARNFKNKERAFNDQIREKQKKIRILKSKINSKTKEDSQKIVTTLEKFMDKRDIPALPENFVRELMFITRQTKMVFINSTVGASIELEDIDYNSIVKNSDTENNYSHLIKNILPFILIFAQNKVNNHEKTPRDDESPHKNGKDTPDDYLELIISEDRLKGLIRIKKPVSDVITIETIEEYLKTKEIRFGIKDEKLIQAWLSNSTINDDPFVIADGVTPEFPEKAKIKYYFKTNFRKAGKIMKDGSIDFRDRGDIPFIKKDTLLAKKTPAVPGRSGIDIFGETIPVAESEDLAFSCGTGTKFSDDKLQIFADADGMPHMDAMGNISVLSELTIKDDVDYKTGNLDFSGNIVVKGVVRAGFSVKCANLTVKQIEGADIDITGDLNVAAGIVDSDLIRVQGNVQAKYINNSEIKAFEDLIVHKEIIDSSILLSGACINEAGNILSSYISAKKGIIAGNIGTEVSSPSKLKVGLNEHIEVLTEQADEKIKKNVESVKKIKKEISECETENNELNAKISQFAFVQDRSEIKLREIEKKMHKLKDSENITELKKITDSVNRLRGNIKLAEHKLNIAFTRQDALTEKILEKENKIKEYEADNKKLLQYKRDLKERSDRDESFAEVKVNKKIMPGTLIIGPNSSMTIKEPNSRCKIVEFEVKEEEQETVMYYKMDISPL